MQYPRCPECGSEVLLMKKEGRTREYLRGVHLFIPDDYEIPACTACGEESMNIEVSEPLDKILGENLRHILLSYVEKLRERGFSRLEIGDALGVTRQHFSRVLSGEKEPNSLLVKMLSLFINVPGAFERAFYEGCLNGVLTMNESGVKF
jgi:transcriptional regulator with XRE-family HTH domain